MHPFEIWLLELHALEIRFNQKLLGVQSDELLEVNELLGYLVAVLLLDLVEERVLEMFFLRVLNVMALLLLDVLDGLAAEMGN